VQVCQAGVARTDDGERSVTNSLLAAKPWPRVGNNKHLMKAKDQNDRVKMAITLWYLWSKRNAVPEKGTKAKEFRTAGTFYQVLC